MRNWSSILRVSVVLAAAAIIPACGGTVTNVPVPGPAGPGGPAGAGVNPVLDWSDPVNLSQQTVINDDTAYGQQAVFTPDGRLHVVYFAWDQFGSDVDELWYTSAAAPFTAWDLPTRLTNEDVSGYTVDEFSLAAGSDNSLNLVYSANSGVSEESIFYVKNTAAARLVFTEVEIFEELNGTGTIYTPRIVMRGSVAHVVWVDDDAANDLSYFYSNNSAAGVFFVAPTILDSITWSSISENQLVLMNDAAGNTHVVYGFNNGGNSGEEIRYRGIPAGAGNAGVFGAVQIANDTNGDSIWFSQGIPPIVKLDGSNNLYVFWKQYGPGNSSPAVYGNIKAAGGSFVRANAVSVTETPDGDDIAWGFFPRVGDVEVTSAGRINVAWRTTSSYGTNDLYPVYYRTKNPGTNPTVGWQSVEVAAWTYDTPLFSGLANGGLGKTTLVREAADGSVQLYYADEYNAYDLFSAVRAPGSSTWRQGGSPSQPSTHAFYPDGFAYNYILEAGFESDGSPAVLFAADPTYNGTQNGDLTFTHKALTDWMTGTDVNGVENADVYGDMWVGRDAAGKWHVIWQQEVDPFNSYDEYDLLHSMQP